MRDPIIVVGGGIGGLTTALALHRRGLECRVFEQSPTIRELGVGINTLPHAIGELQTLDLLEQLDAVAVRTYELIYMNRFGQEVWRELRGLDAGHPVPQFSIHRGVLQGVLRDAVVDRLGAEVVCTNCRLTGFAQDDDGVTATFEHHDGTAIAPVINMTEKNRFGRRGTRTGSNEPLPEYTTDQGNDRAVAARVTLRGATPGRRCRSGFGAQVDDVAGVEVADLGDA